MSIMSKAKIGRKKAQAAVAAAKLNGFKITARATRERARVAARALALK